MNLQPYLNSQFHYLYVLELTNYKWYIGETSNLEKRMQQHFNGEGSEWSKLYSPLHIKEIRLLSKDQNTLLEERNLTVEYMLKYGFSNVRGSQWCCVNYYKEPDWRNNHNNISLELEDETINTSLDDNVPLYNATVLGLRLNIAPTAFNNLLNKKGFIVINPHYDKNESNSLRWLPTENALPFCKIKHSVSNSGRSCSSLYWKIDIINQLF